jgi:hypothetical protein
VRETTDIASGPAHRADGGVVLKSSLASSLGRQVVPDIGSCTKLSGAFAFFVKSATGAHPHVRGSSAEICAALGMPPMGEHVLTCSAVDRNKNQPNVGAACE